MVGICRTRKIVGTALIDAIACPGDPAQNAAKFVSELSRGLQIK